MSDEAVPTSPSPKARTGRRRPWTAAAAWRAALRLPESSPLRGVASACAARVRRSWLYRFLVGMSTWLRRCAPALCTVALLGLIGTGVWATLDQYSEQRRVSSSAQAAQPERSSGSGITAPGQPTDLTRSAGRASGERQITVPSQTTPGAIETGTSSFSISRLTTRTAAVLLNAARFLLPLLVDFWLVLPAVLVPVVLVRMHCRRRSRRSQNETDPLPALENAGRDGRTEWIEALDEAETDTVEAAETVDLVDEEVAAGLIHAAGESVRRGDAAPPPATASTAALGRVALTDPLVEPEESRAGERHTVGGPEPAQDVRYVASRHDVGKSRPWKPEEALPEASAYLATSRVSIIGTTIWAREKPTEPAQVPTQSRSRAETRPAPHPDAQQVARPQQQDAPAARLIDQQDALRRRQRAAAQRALRVRA